MEKHGPRPWILYLIREGIIRPRLTDLYASIAESTDNAHTLIDRNPEEIDWNVTKGSSQIKDCFVRATKWLADLKEFVLSSEIYSKQILEPVRLVASYLIHIRSLQSHTVKTFGWVFSKSKPYDDTNYGGKRVMLSILFPELQNAMTLRCTVEQANRMEHGMYDFDEIQPLPFVNRIHQFHPSIEKNSKLLKLSDYHFLKVSCDDVELFSRTLSLENFCDVESSQSNRKHNLGAPMILSGKIISVKGHNITLQSVTQKTIRLNVSQQLENNTGNGNVELFQNKLVRVLCIWWYQVELESNPTPEYPEAFYIDVVKNESELLEDDMVGFVRLRGSVKNESIFAKYPNVKIDKVSRLVSTGGSLGLPASRSITDNPIIAEFLKTTNQIRNLRKELKVAETILVMPEEILDTDKISIEGLVKILKNNEELKKILLTAIGILDMEGSVESKELEDSVGMEHPTFRKKLLWFGYVGLILEDEEKLMFTKEGKEVAYLILREKIRNLINTSKSNRIIYLPDLETNGIPASLLIRSLHTPEDNPYFKRVISNGVPCNLFWACSPFDTDEETLGEVKKRLASLYDQILLIFSKQSYPLTILKLVEDLENNSITMSYYSTNQLVSKMEREGKLTRDGNSWVYPLEARITDLLTMNPNKVFSVDEIIEKTMTPLLEKKKCFAILELLAKKRIASPIKPGFWTFADNLLEKLKISIKSEIKNFIINLLKERSLGADRLYGLVDHHSNELCSSTVLKKDWMEIGRETIVEMIRDEIIVIDGICKLKRQTM